MKKILYFFILLFLIPPKVFAINTDVANIYENFTKKLESSYSLSKQEEIFHKISSQAKKYYWNENYAEKQQIFSDLLTLNNEKLYGIWEQNYLTQSQQKITELSYRKSLSNTLVEISHPTYISSLLEKNNIFFITTNQQREFLENNTIKKIEYSLYYPLDSTNSSAFRNKSGIIIFEDEQYRFIEEYSFTTKIPYSELSEKGFIFLTDEKKFAENNAAYYGYNFTKFRYFADEYGIYESQLEKENFAPENTLIYRNIEGQYNFVTQYDALYLGAQEIFFGVSEKHMFLNNLADDMLYASANPENILRNIQTISQDILEKSDSHAEYIEKIYDYILENISYTENIKLENTEIFSGLETFVRGDGVCTGYTKLMAYMMSYGNISDVELIRGYVIDAQDFPQIGHAWIRIGNEYYDPTFDDPVGIVETRKFEDYIYFGLPKDIFYANRYTYEDLPLGLKAASSSEISSHIYDRLKRLIPKYRQNISKYKVFGPVVFRETHNISQDTQVTPEVLASAIGSFQVQNDSFRFVENGNTRQITSFRYFKLDNENTEQILTQLAYDVEDLYLFDWQTESGSREWRLAYEIELR